MQQQPDVQKPQRREQDGQLLSDNNFGRSVHDWTDDKIKLLHELINLRKTKAEIVRFFNETGMNLDIEMLSNLVYRLRALGKLPGEIRFSKRKNKYTEETRNELMTLAAQGKTSREIFDAMHGKGVESMKQIYDFFSAKNIKLTPCLTRQRTRRVRDDDEPKEIPHHYMHQYKKSPFHKFLSERIKYYIKNQNMDYLTASRVARTDWSKFKTQPATQGGYAAQGIYGTGVREQKAYGVNDFLHEFKFPMIDEDGRTILFTAIKNCIGTETPLTFKNSAVILRLNQSAWQDFVAEFSSQANRLSEVFNMPQGSIVIKRIQNDLPSIHFNRPQPGVIRERVERNE